MDRDAPSPQTTLVILLGASDWPDSPDFHGSKAFTNAAHDFREYLLNPNQFGLPKENLSDLFNIDDDPYMIDKKIRQFLDQRTLEMKQTGNAARDLLVYFVGHGGFVERNSEYYLAVRRTSTENPGVSGIRMESFASTITDRARYLRRVIILDCCYAAAAFTMFQAEGPAKLAINQTVNVFVKKAKTVGKGTTLLCSSGRTIASQLLRDGSYTMFSKALLHVLLTGTTSQQGKLYLSLREVADLTEEFINTVLDAMAPRPELHSPDQIEGDVAEIPFFPNLHANVEPLSGGDFGRQIDETLDQSSQGEDTKDPPLSQQLEPTRPITTKHRIPRRLVVIGLVGLVTVVGGSGLSWLALSRRLSLPSFQHEAKWVPTGNMLVGRLSLRATTLMNGMVLIEGGFTSDGLHTAESELFNPRTGIWTGTKGRLNETRAQHTATLLLNGNVLVSGGFAGGNTTRDSAELYDPRTDRWTMTKKMGQPRTRHTATRLQDGKVLIVGGVSLNGRYINTAELYDPVADIWSSAGALTMPRADHVAVRLLDDTVLVAGGTLLNDGQTKTSRTEVYDPSTNGWKLAQDMNVPRAYFTAVLLSTGNVLAIGGRAEGFDSTATTELYNPVRGSWSMTGDMNSNRENVPGQEAVILSDGSVLVVGGNVQGTSETYSPATGKWTGQIKMGSVRSNSATALLKGGQVLVVGGFDCFCPNPDNTHILASAEIYAL